MTIVTEISWDAFASPDFGRDPHGLAWRDAVAACGQGQKRSSPE